jgi:hypothetical protein
MRAGHLIAVRDMMNDPALSSSGRTSTMTTTIWDAIGNSDAALALAGGPADVGPSTLVAAAQVSAIQAVALAIVQLTGAVEHIASAVEQLQRPA